MSASPQAPAPLSLRRNFSWTVVGNVVYAATQWGVLTVIAKLTSPEVLGRYALSLAICTPLFYLSMLQLRGIQATDAKDEYSFGEYVGLRLVATGVVLSALLVTAATVPYFADFATVIALVATIKAVDSLSDILYGLFQKHEQMDMIGRAQIVNGVVSLTLFATGMVLTERLSVALVGSAIGSVGMLAYYSVQAQRMFGRTDAIAGASDATASTATSRRLSVLRPSFRRDRLRTLFVMALPMGVVMMLSTLNTSIPRYVIEWELGERELGVFAALAYLLVAGSTVVAALGQSAAPRLAKDYAAGRRREFLRLLRGLVVFALGLGLAGALLALVAGKPILTLLYTAEYAEDQDVLVALALAASFTFAASYMGFGMTAVRVFGAQLRIGIVVSGVTVVASFVLVPAFGLTGAAAAIGAAQAAKLVLGASIIRGTLRLRGPQEETS